MGIARIKKFLIEDNLSIQAYFVLVVVVIALVVMFRDRIVSTLENKLATQVIILASR